MEDCGYKVFPSFLSQGEVDLLLGEIDSQKSLYRHIPSSTFKTNLPYYILDGKNARKHIKGMQELADSRLRGLVEKFAGRKLKPMDDVKRSLRIQRYTHEGEGILWHIDSGYYTALLTLRNDSKGGIDIFSLPKSKWLVKFAYLLYFWQRLFHLFKPAKVVLDPGDLVIIYGGKAVHRAFNLVKGKERVVLAVSFDPADKKVGWLRTQLLNRFNVTIKTVVNGGT